jgi:hypothetical protein
MGAIESQPNPLPGDYNFDGIVDAADYTVWRDTLGSSTDLRSDCNASGMVDANDYDFWKSRFGNVLSANGAGSGSTAALVGPSAIDLRQGEGGILASIFAFAPGSPAALPGIVRQLSVARLAAFVARQDLLLEAWSDIRSNESRPHDRWSNDLPLHEAAAEKPPRDGASVIDSAFALLGTVVED